jgi:hypothetical protein
MPASPAGALSWSVVKAATYRKSGSCPTCRSTLKNGLAAALCQSSRIPGVTLDGPPRSLPALAGWTRPVTPGPPVRPSAANLSHAPAPICGPTGTRPCERRTAHARPVTLPAATRCPSTPVTTGRSDP